MSSLVWIGFLAFFVSSLTVGVRLLLLWWRTRGLPELLIGLGVLGIGPVGFGLATASQRLRETSPETAAAMLGSGMLAISVGAAAKFVFNWRVYHPDDRTVASVSCLACVALLALWIAELLGPGFVGRGDGELGIARSALMVACLLWGSVEALAWWRKLGRRIRLGLAEPVVANRFLLWGIGAGAAGMGSAVSVGVQVVTGQPTFDVGWVMLSSSLHGLTAAVAMWLAFLPSERYRRWVEARAAKLHSAL